MGDFLHRRAQTPYTETYRAVGVGCSISTNSAQILQAARNSFAAHAHHSAQAEISMRLWVEPQCTTKAPWPKPYVRGLGHMVYAGFAEGNSVVTDLNKLRITGRFSSEFAADTQYWSRVVLPMLLSIIAASVGMAELHCACVAKNGQGLLLAGPSGSGKSTLSLALAYLGFGFLSDDRSLCALRRGELSVHGLPTDLKLRSESARWFQCATNEFRRWADTGEYRVDPKSLRLSRVRNCRPRMLAFLERNSSTPFACEPLSSQEVQKRLHGEMMAELPQALQLQSAVVSALAELPCFLIRYATDPWKTATSLACLFDSVLGDFRSSTCGNEQASRIVLETP